MRFLKNGMIVKDTFQIVKHKVREKRDSKLEKQPRRSNIQLIGRTEKTEKYNTKNKPQQPDFEN